MTRKLSLAVALLAILVVVWKLSEDGRDAADAEVGSPTDPPSAAEPAEPGTAILALPESGAEPLRSRDEVPVDGEGETTPSPTPDKRDGVEPESSGATAQTTSARVWLVGRVVDAVGAPLADRALPTRFQVHRGMFGPTHFAEEVTTDADGRFRQDLRESWLEKGTPMTLELVDPDAPLGDTGYRPSSSTDDPKPLAARATFVVPSFLSNGEHNLGEAEVRGPRVLVSGRAVDGRSAPIEDARVTIRWAHAVTTPPRADPERYLREMWWMLDGVEARSSETGSYELIGFAPNTRLEVEARKDGYLDAKPVKCEIGAADIHVVMHQGGGIAGRALFDEGIARDRFQVEVRVGEGMEGFRRLDLSEDGDFEAIGLPPGLGRVSLVLKPDGDTLAEFDDVVVGSGTPYRDPRLDPLDLRGAMTRAIVTVLGTDGKRLPSAEGRVVGMNFPDTSSREFLPRDDPGVLDFLGMGSELDVEIWATGYRAEVLADLRGEVEVQLQPGTPVRVELTSTPPLEQGEMLRVMLEVEDEYWRQVTVDAIEPGGSAELVSSHGGRHQFSLWLEIKTPETSGHIRIQSPEATAEFEVTQGADPGAQTLVLTDAALATARETWQRFR